MRFSTILSAGAVLASAVSASASDVVDLTDKNFDSEVMSEQLALVEFFAPWCGHCKNLAPEYEVAASALKSNPSAEAVGGSIKLAKVDCTENTELCQKFQVQGYPTLKVFRNGQHTEYGGPRKSDGIVSYMLKQSLPSVATVASKDYDSFKDLETVVLVAHYPDEASVPKTYRKLADELRENYLFGHSTDQSLAPSELSSSGIVLYKKFDEGKAIYTGDVNDEEELTTFIAENALPLIDEVSPENYALYAQSGLPLAYLFVDADSSAKDTLVESIKSVAKDYKKKLNFVWIDAKKFNEHGKALAIDLEDLPGFIIQDFDMESGVMRKFVDTVTGAKMDISSIKDFLTRYSTGKVQATLKSEPVPASQDEAAYHLVTDEYDSVVFDDNKDVFIEYYAPWCGHCRKCQSANPLEDTSLITYSLQSDWPLSGRPWLSTLKTLPTLS